MSSIGLLAFAALFCGTPGMEDVGEEHIRTAIQRSIPYIEEKGDWWIEEKKCVSCHRAGTMVWSLSAAKQQGFRVSDRLDDWLQWSLETSLSKNADDKVVGAGNKEGLVQLLMTRQYAPSNEAREQSFIELTKLIAQDQQADGSWSPGGQLPTQKRALAETTVVSSMWLALALANQDAQQQFGDQVSKAVDYIDKSEPGKSTEWYTARLLLAKQLGDRQNVGAMVEKLVGQQHEDGGWGWIVGEKSDALGTGLTLFALQLAGVDQPEVLKRATAFLLESQQEDGSWPVPGTKENKRNGIEETATYWGTTWAVLALTDQLAGRSDSGADER